MPYIITTETVHWAGPSGGTRVVDTSRRAVATLFEAREEAACHIERVTGGDEDYEELYEDAQGCSEWGDSFGPLPNGTMVQVSVVTWAYLAAETGKGDRWAPDGGRAAVLDAFNAAN